MLPQISPSYVLPSQPYDVNVFYPGAPLTAAIILYIKFVRTVIFPINLTGSVAGAITAATASTTFNIQKNGVTVGTIIFVGIVGSFTFTSAVSFAAGDILSIVAPTTPDAALALINVTLTGVR